MLPFQNLLVLAAPSHHGFLQEEREKMVDDGSLILRWWKSSHIVIQDYVFNASILEWTSKASYMLRTCFLHSPRVSSLVLLWKLLVSFSVIYCCDIFFPSFVKLLSHSSPMNWPLHLRSCYLCPLPFLVSLPQCCSLHAVSRRNILISIFLIL